MAAKADRILDQVGALPFRRGEAGAPQVLLVTSRETRRWTIPKGWPMKGLKDRKAAALEALQEAGVEGKVGKAPMGSYLYWKRQQRHFDLCRVAVYALEVSNELDDWREKNERQRRWFAVEEAAELVAEPQLVSLVAGLGEGAAGDAPEAAQSRK